jgi:hypothetical protein
VLRQPRAHRAAGRAYEYHALFWGISVLGTVAGFMFTTAPSDVLSARYLAVAFVGVGVLLPLLAARTVQGRRWFGVAISLFAAVAVAHLISSGVPRYGTGPGPAVAREVQRYVAANGAAHGYAEYQDAAVLTWETKLHTLVYPVETCGAAAVCPFDLHVISSWYRPTSVARTFLITDTAPALIRVATAPSTLGRSIMSAKFGTLTVNIYDGDIATHFGP